MGLITLHRVVEPRTESLDQLQLLEQRRKLARSVLPVYRNRLAQNAGALLFGIGAAEVAEQPGPDTLGLPDIHDFAGGREHSIDARPICRSRADNRPHVG